MARVETLTHRPAHHEPYTITYIMLAEYETDIVLTEEQKQSDYISVTDHEGALLCDIKLVQERL